MAKPIMNGKVVRNTRTASGFHEDHAPTKVVSKDFNSTLYEVTHENRFPGLNHKGSVPFHASSVNREGKFANKIPGKGSPQHAKPKVAKFVHGGPGGKKTGAQTKLSPKLVGY